MRFYVWQAHDIGSGWAMATELKGWSAEQENAVFQGQPAPEPLPRVEVTELSKGRPGETIGTPTYTRLVNVRLRDVLHDAVGEGVQFIEATVPGANHPYYVANLLEHVACLDRKKSDVEEFPRPPHAIRKIRRMVLTNAADHAPAAFHLAEHYPILLVREDLRKKMDSPSAGVFIATDEYTRGV